MKETAYRFERIRWNDEADRLIKADPVLNVLLELETALPFGHGSGTLRNSLGVYTIALDNVQDDISQLISGQGHFLDRIFDSHDVTGRLEAANLLAKYKVQMKVGKKACKK